MPKTPEQLARKRARKAEREQRRRALKPGYKPRSTFEAEALTRTRPWNADGISRSQWYANRRLDDRVPIVDGSVPALDTSVPSGVDNPVPMDGCVPPVLDSPVPFPVVRDDHVSLDTAHLVEAEHEDGDASPAPVPPIVVLGPSVTKPDLSRADALIAQVRHLPGGSDPQFQANLRRLVADAEARERHLTS